MKTKYLNLQILIAATLLVGLTSCGNKKGDADASGTFEATEVIVLLKLPVKFFIQRRRRSGSDGKSIFRNH